MLTSILAPLLGPTLAHLSDLVPPPGEVSSPWEKRPILQKTTAALHSSTVLYKDVACGPENAHLVRKKNGKLHKHFASARHFR